MTATAPDAATSAPPEGPPGRHANSTLDVLMRVVLAAGSGAVLYLSFPPRPLWWLAPLAFTGLGLALRNRRARAAFGYGLVFGVTFYLLHLVWIEDFLGADFGSTPWLALSGLMGLFAALACAAMPLVARLPAAPVWMASLYLGQEALRTLVPLNGFPWGRVAFSQPEGVFTSLASIGGAPLVGFAVLVTGFGLAQLLGSARERGRWRPSIGASLAVVLPIVAGLCAWPTIGTAGTSGSLVVAVVQGNAPNLGLGLLGAREEIRANHLAESERLRKAIAAGAPRPDLVVWPETATDVAGHDREIDRVVDEFGVPAVIGSLYHLPGGFAENAAVLWQPGTGQAERYAKQELVPFAEYVPLRPIARWFTPFLDNTADMRAGTSPGVLDTGVAKVGVAICYEAAYDYVARESVRAGANLIAVPTNNAWYGPGEMSYQQLAMSRLRAVEHGRAVVVAATSGVSAIVLPDGSIARDSELFTAQSLVESVPLRDSTTVATVLGTWPERLIVGAGVLTLLGSIWFRLRGRTSKRTRTGEENT